MQDIIDFFKMIKDGAVAAFDFLVGFIEDIVSFVEFLGKIVAKIPDYLGFLPTAAVSCVLLALTLIVILRITGRD